jgi:hypothetical protein
MQATPTRKLLIFNIYLFVACYLLIGKCIAKTRLTNLYTIKNEKIL